jgi:hypothetical protein
VETENSKGTFSSFLAWGATAIFSLFRRAASVPLKGTYRRPKYHLHKFFPDRRRGDGSESACLPGEGDSRL